MASITTDVSTSAATGKPKRGGSDNLESEAIGLEVAVRIHGSQVAAVVLDTTEHVEPFEEDTSTMIVFPRGAVVKLRARVRSGHAVVLTHLGSKQTALCRIIQVNSTANVSHYVKLEFIQPVPGFWGVHFPSDSNQPAVKHDAQPALNDELEKLVAPEIPAKPAPTATAPPTVPFSSIAVTPHTETKQALPEIVKEPIKVIPPPVNYGISEDVHKSEVVPLANVPGKRPQATPKAQLPIPSPAPATDAPIFDSLSTDEEVFGKEANREPEESSIFRSEQRATPVFARTLDPSLLSLAGETPKTHTGAKIFLTIAAAALVAAGAVYYVRQYRGNARQNATAIPSAIVQQPASATPGSVPTQPGVQSSASGTVNQTPTDAKRAPFQQVADETTITVTPVHSTAKNPASDTHSTASNGIASMYAGDLSARPQIAQRSKVAVTAPLPTINTSPKDLTGGSAGTGLGSLVSNSSPGLPAPPKPVEPTPARGGQVVSPRLLHSVPLSYPALAASSHIEGDVVIEAVIDPTGKVTSTKVISGPGLLRNSAMDTVRKQRYSPATLDGKPITIEYKVTIRFRLNN